jgi:hypothetical protein
MMLPDDFAAFEREQLENFPNKHYGPAAIAKGTGTSRWLVDKAIHDGTLPAFRFGAQKVTVLRRDLIRWLWNRRVTRPKEIPPPEQPVARPRRGRPPNVPVRTRHQRRQAARKAGSAAS